MLLCGMLWITGRCSKCVSGSPIQFGIKRGVWGQRIGEVPKGWIVYPAKMSLVLGIRKSTILDPSKDSVLLFALKEVAKLWRIVGQTGRYEKFSGILCANNWWLSFRNMVGHYGGRTGSALIMKFNSSQNFDYVRRSVTKVSEDYRGPIRQRLIARFFPHLNRDDEQMGRSLWRDALALSRADSAAFSAATAAFSEALAACSAAAVLRRMKSICTNANTTKPIVAMASSHVGKSPPGLDCLYWL